MATDTANPVTESTGGGSDLGALSAQELGHWRQTGEMPGAPDQPSTPPTDSSPVEPAAQDVSTDMRTPPASEPGTPKKANASTRKAEVEAEVAALKSLLAERHELRQRLERESSSRPEPPQTPRADSSPAADRSLSQEIQAPDVSSPMMDDEAFFARYPEAKLGDHARYVARYEIAQDKAVTSVTSERQSRLTTYKQRVDSAVGADPQFWTSVRPDVAQLQSLDQLSPDVTPGPLNYAAQEIVESAIPDKLIGHLNAHPELLDQMRQMSPAQAIRTMAKLEATLGSSVTPAAPAVLPVSLAPPPPATLGKKPGQPADELSEAIRQGDFARYRELQNRKEMKRA